MPERRPPHPASDPPRAGILHRGEHDPTQRTLGREIDRDEVENLNDVAEQRSCGLVGELEVQDRVVEALDLWRDL